MITNIKKSHNLPQCKIVHVAADTTTNAGDYILVRSLRKLIEQYTGEKIDWHSVYVRNAVDKNFTVMSNSSKGVVIGGGGLFLASTNSNKISGWQWPCPIDILNAIKVPVYVMGVGYNRFRGEPEFDDCFRENINKLVEKSTFFGLRNQGSIDSILNYLKDNLKKKVVYHPCSTTVLSKIYPLPFRNPELPSIAINCAFDRENLRYQGKCDEIMFAIAKVAKRLSNNYRIKYYVHCKGDKKMAAYLHTVGVEFDEVQLTRELTEEEFLRYFTEPELMLSIRGHAQMLPFGCITPAISMITHDKLQWFLNDICHPEWGIEVLDCNFEAKLLDKSLYMLKYRNVICNQIQNAQNKLWTILQNNLKFIYPTNIGERLPIN